MSEERKNNLNDILMVNDLIIFKNNTTGGIEGETIERIEHINDSSKSADIVKTIYYTNTQRVPVDPNGTVIELNPDLYSVKAIYHATNEDCYNCIYRYGKLLNEAVVDEEKNEAEEPLSDKCVLCCEKECDLCECYHNTYNYADPQANYYAKYMVLVNALRRTKIDFKAEKNEINETTYTFNLSYSKTVKDYEAQDKIISILTKTVLNREIK